MEAMIAAWTFRDSQRAVALSQQLREIVTPAIGQELEPVFGLINAALRPPIEKQTLEGLEELSSKGLAKVRDDGVSELAQILATASLVSLEHDGKWDSPELTKLLLRFDANRAKLQRIKHRAEIADAGLGNLAVFMLFGDGAVGGTKWRSMVLDVANSKSEPAADELNSYLMDLAFNHYSSGKAYSGSFDKLYWNLLDTTYVAAFVSNYRYLLASARLLQAQYASKEEIIRPNQTWALYYEAISLNAERDYNTPAFEELLSETVTYLSRKETTNSPGTLPALTSKWSDEFEGRFLNLLGWILLRKGHYAEALKTLSKAELIILMQDCFWLKQGERCIDNVHPSLVSVRDNLAEVYLALGQGKKALTAAARANIYRNKLAKVAGAGADEIPLGVITSHYKILAASLLQIGDKEATAKGQKILDGLNSTIVDRIAPRIPSRYMFDVIVNGKNVNLVQFMTEQPDWDKRADALKAYKEEAQQ